MLDPHTAIGYAAACSFLASNENSSPMVIVGTAHPGKFLPTVEHALGGKREGVEQHPILSKLNSLSKKNHVLNSIDPSATMQYIKEVVEQRKKRNTCVWSEFLNKCPYNYHVLATVTIGAIGLISLHLFRKR